MRGILTLLHTHSSEYTLRVTYLYDAYAHTALADFILLSFLSAGQRAANVATQLQLSIAKQLHGAAQPRPQTAPATDKRWAGACSMIICT